MGSVSREAVKDHASDLTGGALHALHHSSRQTLKCKCSRTEMITVMSLARVLEKKG